MRPEHFSTGCETCNIRLSNLTESNVRTVKEKMLYVNLVSQCHRSSLDENGEVVEYLIERGVDMEDLRLNVP